MTQVNYIKVGGYVYSENDCIGKGSFGKVYKGKSLATGAIVAIKIIYVENAKQTTLIKMIKNEVDALKKVKNENIVEFFEFTVMNNHVYIITELCNQRDLKYYLSKYKILGEKKVVEFLKQILNAFKEMCAKKVFHRDLKPANVLLHNGICKIADFGFAKRLDFDVTDYNAQMVSVVGTPLYMAPQLLDKQKYSTKSDIWSIGIITHEMLFGKAPWVGNDPVTYSKNIKNQPLTIDRTINYISGEAEDFLRQCLQVTEEDRIGWEELFKHPFVYDGPQSDTSTQEDSKDEDLLGEINPEKMVKAHCRGPINPSNLMKLYQQKTLGASRDILNSNVEPTKTTIDQKLKNIHQLIVSQSILGKGMPLTPITPLNKSLNFSMGDEMNKTLTNIKSNNENLVHMNRFKSNILSNSREISHSPDIMNTNLSKKVSDEAHEEFKKIENPIMILKNKIEIFIDLHTIINESEEFKDVPVIKFNLLLTLSKLVNMVFKEFSSQVLTKKIKTRSNLLAEYVESDSFKRLLVFAETEKKGVDDMIKNCSRRMFELPLGSDKEKDELLEYYHETCNEVEEIAVLGKIIDISNQMLYQLRFNSQIFRKSGANLEASKNNKLSLNKKYLEGLLSFLGDDNIIDLFKYDKIDEVKYKLDKLKEEAGQK